MGSRSLLAVRSIVLLIVVTAATLVPSSPAAAHHNPGEVCPAGPQAPAYANLAFPSLWRSAVSANSATNGDPWESEFFGVGSGHQGEDVFPLLASAASGTRYAVAVADGIVEGPFNQFGGNGPGWVVKIRTSGWLYKYFHLHDDPALYGLTVGGTVSKGQIIGRVGNTGNASGTRPHVHFEMWLNSTNTLHCPFYPLVESYSTPGMISHTTAGTTTLSPSVYAAYLRVGSIIYAESRFGVPAANCLPGDCLNTRVHYWGGSRIQGFDGGSYMKPIIIEATNGTDAGVAWGLIGERYKADGGPAVHGPPRDGGGGYDEHEHCGSRVNDFAGSVNRPLYSSIYYNYSTGGGGVFNVWGYPYVTYVLVNGACSVFGPPIGNTTFWFADGTTHYYGFATRATDGTRYWIWGNNAGGFGGFAY